MTNETNTQIDNTNNDASNTALAQKGKSVRATSLRIGDSYVMAHWFPVKTYEQVRFAGFGRSRDAVSAAIPQLKSLTALDKFYFVASDGSEIIGDGRQQGNVFMGEGAGHRVTFFELLNSTTAIEATPDVTSEQTAAAIADIGAELAALEPNALIGDIAVHIQGPLQDSGHISELVITEAPAEIVDYTLLQPQDEAPVEEVVEAAPVESFGHKMARLNREKKAAAAAAAAEAAAAVEAQIASAMAD